MKRAALAVGISVLTLGSVSTGYAQQQQIQWKQVYNMPKGENQPKGMSIDILGIELGDTYKEAKAKLEKLMAENRQGQAGTGDGPPLSEQTTIIRYQTPGGIISVEFVGQITMRRELPNGNAKISELVDVHFTAPSSGAQVFTVKRDLSYNNGEQPRVSQLIQSLKDKLRADGQLIGVNRGVYRYQFDSGRLVAFNPPTPGGECNALFIGTQTRSSLKGINANGVCDVRLEAQFTFGISPEHVRRVEFWLSDQERAKANKEADYAFVDSYIRDLQSQSKGVVPKL